MSIHPGRSREERAGDSTGNALGDQWFQGCRYRAAALGRPCVRQSSENSLQATAERAAQGNSGYPP